MCVIYKKHTGTDNGMVTARGQGAGDVEEGKGQGGGQKETTFWVNPGCSGQMIFY